MSTESAEETVLAPLDAAHLEALGSASPVYQGKRKVSSSTWSSSTTTLTTVASLDSTLSIEIPEAMRSEESFVFLGCTKSLAKTLWQRWLAISPEDRGPDGPISFMSLAETVVARHEDDVWCANEDWIGMITSLGFATEVAEAICDPQYDAIRFTASAKFWLLDTIQLRWRSLEELQDISRSRLRKAQSKTHTSSLMTRGGGDKFLKNADYVPGSTILWRGSDNKYLQGLIDPNTGAVDLDRMQASWPNDFHGLPGKGAVYHFSPQKAVGLKYAQYARKRSGGGTASVVRMEVPNKLLEKYNPLVVQYENSDMWRTVIWHCRTRRRFPKPFFSHLNNAEVLIGPICRSDDSAIEKLDSWEDITDRHILKVEEEVWNEKEGVHEFKQRRGIQYVFLGLDIQRDLEANCKIEIQPCN